MIFKCTHREGRQPTVKFPVCHAHTGPIKLILIVIDGKPVTVAEISAEDAGPSPGQYQRTHLRTPNWLKDAPLVTGRSPPNRFEKPV